MTPRPAGTVSGVPRSDSWRSWRGELPANSGTWASAGPVPARIEPGRDRACASVRVPISDLM
jgi:hypothetical protein